MSDDIVRRVEDASAATDRACDLWAERHHRLVDLLTASIDAPLPAESFVENLRLEAVAAYEAMLDAMKVGCDLGRELSVAIALQQARNAQKKPPA